MYAVNIDGIYEWVRCCTRGIHVLRGGGGVVGC